MNGGVLYIQGEFPAEARSEDIYEQVEYQNVPPLSAEEGVEGQLNYIPTPVVDKTQSMGRRCSVGDDAAAGQVCGMTEKRG